MQSFSGILSKRLGNGIAEIPDPDIIVDIDPFDLPGGHTGDCADKFTSISTAPKGR